VEILSPRLYTISPVPQPLNLFRGHWFIFVVVFLSGCVRIFYHDIFIDLSGFFIDPIFVRMNPDFLFVYFERFVRTIITVNFVRMLPDFLFTTFVRICPDIFYDFFIIRNFLFRMIKNILIFILILILIFIGPDVRIFRIFRTLGQNYVIVFMMIVILCRKFVRKSVRISRIRSGHLIFPDISDVCRRGR
jgi:hypothetical protein